MTDKNNTEKNKRPRPLSLSPDNIEWIERHAAQQTIEQGKYVSASALVDDLLTQARQEEAPKKAGK